MITGFTQGIGFAIAKGLLKEGTKVCINGRTQEKIDESIQKLKAEIPVANVEGIVADFSKVNEVDDLIEKLPSVDILVNNVGIYGDQPFESTDDEAWFHDFEVNVMSGVRLSRYYAPVMKENGLGRFFFYFQRIGNQYSG